MPVAADFSLLCPAQHESASRKCRRVLEAWSTVQRLAMKSLLNSVFRLAERPTDSIHLNSRQVRSSRGDRYSASSGHSRLSRVTIHGTAHALLQENPTGTTVRSSSACALPGLLCPDGAVDSLVNDSAEKPQPVCPHSSRCRAILGRLPDLFDHLTALYRDCKYVCCFT